MVQAMYEYDTYGEATIREWPIADLDRNGDVTISDEEWFVSQYVGSSGVATDYVYADMDKDGDFDGDDWWIIVGNEEQYPEELTYSSLDNPYLFTGRETDTWHAGSIYVSEDPDYQRNQWNRNRNYDPKHGRWFQRDPLGVRVDAPRGMIDPSKQYTDGMNGYEYVGSKPSRFADPAGRFVFGFGLEASGTIMLPPLSGGTLLAPGLQLSWTEMGFVGYTFKRGSICKVCSTGSVTVMGGLGASLIAGIAPVVAFGKNGPTEGFSVSVGAGGALPTTPGLFGPAIEVAADYDLSSGMTTLLLPGLKLAGGAAYIAVRVSANCTGCSNGIRSAVSGWPTRKAKLKACMTKIRSDIAAAISDANGVYTIDELPMTKVQHVGRATEDLLPTQEQEEW